MEIILFYIFASLLVISGLNVVFSRNPIHAVLALIFAFVNASALFILLGAEYLAMTLMVVYVGAVAVLFLFIIMMLDIDVEKIKEGLVKNKIIASFLAIVFLAQISILIYTAIAMPVARFAPQYAIDKTSNIEAIGNILYTDFIYSFQIAGLILLVGMIGAITLTLRKRAGVRKQNIYKQNAHTPADAIELIKVESGSGA